MEKGEHGAQKKESKRVAPSSSSPRRAKSSRSDARTTKTADNASSPSPRPAKQSSSLDSRKGGESKEQLEAFFIGEKRESEKVTGGGTNRMAAAPAESPHEPVAPRALESIKAYAVPPSALVWVKVGDGFYYDLREMWTKYRPGYVLPPAELKDLGIPKPVGGELMRVVRLFDDHAFGHWNAPKAVRASETEGFGVGPTSTKWNTRKVDLLERDCSSKEFAHVYTRPTSGRSGGTSGELEYRRADGAYDAVREHLLEAAVRAGADRAHAAELVDVLVDADVFQSSLRQRSSARSQPLGPPAALDDAPDDADAGIVAACAKSLGDVVDGTLIERIKGAERWPAAPARRLFNAAPWRARRRRASRD
ncbi:hypothetical protein SO694_00040029 [Aureococcus anophagefferens]|uniref:Cytochrome b5 heme-binding domain-containing protein n=1 Tax=Aureococcus anophagefferens TaxID=44056 RepID=A0ABR1G6Q6_AURAN